jgi:energy-coupling factor transporter ATP-binding protein EcfA2
MSENFTSVLDAYTNKGGKISGRSSSTTSGIKTVTEAPELTASAKSYDRPNGDLYYTRKWGEHDDVSVLRTAREDMQFVLLYGAPGCGKTALVEAAFGENLVTVLGSGDTEVADLVGGYTQTPDGKWLWTDGPLLKAAEAGEPLLIDEVGLIDPKVLSIVYGLMDGRREYTVTANPERGTVKAKDGFYVVGATNPNAPGVRLSEALLSRFTIHVEMTTDWSLAKKLGVPANIVTASQNLAKKQTSGEVSWSPQFRELLAFRDIENKFGTKFAVANLLAASPEMDRPVVADVFSRTYGEAVLPARI